MFPFPYYNAPQPQQRGRGRGRFNNFRRGRGQRGGRFPRPDRPENQPPPAEPPPEKRDEKKEVKEVTRALPGVTLVGCQVQLSISLRQVGFLVQELFSLLQQNNVDVQCTRFQLYRIMLYAIEVKIINQSKRAGPWFRLPEMRSQIIERIISALETDLRLRRPFVDYLASIGEFELNSSYYSVFVPDFQGPHPLYTTIDTLWGTVLALANPATPQLVRQLYYINSSLPGALWDNPDNPVLNNPQDFMNQAYDINAFENDLVSVNALNTVLCKRRWPDLVAEKVDFSKSGDAAVLVSSTLQDSVVRCVFLLPQGQTVEGNRTDFNVTSPGISNAHTFKGAKNLYSEIVRMNGAVSLWDNNRAAGYFQLRIDWRSELRKLFTTA